jgi:molybdenum cofactor cytidylyltransferase
VIAAIVLAAGASTRMGRPKAALPLGAGETLLSRGVASLRAAGIRHIVVVAGAHPEAVRTALGHDADTRVVDNPRWSDGQLSSLLCGLDAVAGDPEAIVVTLVDVPLVSADTTRRLIDTWRDSGAPIVRPARRGEHGHPVLFDCCLFDELRAADVRDGAKPVVRAHAHELIDVAVEDDGAFLDVDTPADYTRAQALAAAIDARRPAPGP